MGPQFGAFRGEDTIASDRRTSITDNYAENYTKNHTDNYIDNSLGHTYLTTQTQQLDQTQAAVPASSDIETQPYLEPNIPPPAQMSLDLHMIPTESMVDNFGGYSYSETDIPLDPLLFTFWIPPSS